MPYTPPPGNQVGANFTATYTPPPGNQVGARFGSEPNTVEPIGFDALDVGTPRISFYVQVVTPPSITPLAFGLAELNFTQYATPPGFMPLQFGTAVVSNSAQGIFAAGLDHLQFGYAVAANVLTVAYPTGFDASAIGAHAIQNYRNTLAPPGADTLEFGLAWVSNEIRRFDVDGFDTMAFGTAFISNAVQHVEPNGLTQTEFGDTRVSRNIVIEPVGIAGAVGTPTVLDNRRIAEPPGLLATQFGQTFIRRAYDRIAVDGIPSLDEFGDVDVYNQTREIKVYWPVDHVAGPVPSPTVSNFDREIHPFGFDALRIRDYHTVSQGPPPPVLTAGDTAQFGQTFVSHKIRAVSPPGLSAFQDGRATVYNAAAALYPGSFTATDFGRPLVFNGLQFVDVINRYPIDSYGTPTISHAVRTIHAPSIFDTAYGTPTIGHTPQIIAPPGQYMTAFGAHYAERRQMIVYAQSLSPHTEFGRASVVNRNVESRALGFTATTYGFPKIELYRRYLQPAGISQLEFGSHGISHVLRTVAPPSITGAFGLCWVHIEPQPPAPQTVYVDAFEALGMSALHTVSANSIFPLGATFTEFGTASVTSNVIRPIGIFEDFIADTRPSLTTTQVVFLGDEHGGGHHGIDSLQMGKPRMSPYTIWAPAGAPQQAKDNHPPGLEFEIDEPAFGGEHPLFGTATISNAIRFFNIDGIYATEFGTATVVRGGTQWVYPEGKDTKRFGIPVMLGGTLTVEPAGILAEEIGQHAVTRVVGPYLQEIGAGGLLSQAFGQAFVSTRPQDVFPAGESEDLHGTQWISHEYPPFEIPGFEATEFGDAWVSNYVREVSPEGFDALSTGDEPGYFDQRMRVGTRIGGTGLGVGDTLSMGMPAVALGLRIIQAFGPSTLSVPAPRVQMVVRTDGIEATTLGSPTIDQVVPGAVFQHGNDMSSVGTPAVIAVIRIAGIGGQVGTPGIAHLLSGVGFESLEFGGPVIAGNGLACGSAVQGVMAGAFNSEQFGTASVMQ